MRINRDEGSFACDITRKIAAREDRRGAVACGPSVELSVDSRDSARYRATKIMFNRQSTAAKIPGAARPSSRVPAPGRGPPYLPRSRKNRAPGRELHRDWLWLKAIQVHARGLSDQLNLLRKPG